MNIAEKRYLLDELPLDAREVLNDCIMQIAIGNRYDERAERTPDGLRVQWSQRHLRMLEWLEEERERLELDSPTLLDVGCWQGKLVAELCQRGFRVGGVDLAAMEHSVLHHLDMALPYAREYYAGFHQGWAHELLGGTAAGAWDIVLCEETLEHIPTAVLEQTCDAILQSAAYSLECLFLRDGWRMEILQAPGNEIYTTIKMVR
jgi:2-polyprenyl-3-methyl-5-hydroxy-6-metoxy-1,4-benzoquinol methylase